MSDLSPFLFGKTVSIHAIRIDTREDKDLSNHLGRDWSPSLSPDGTRIAFSSDRGGNPDIYTMNADGTHVRNISNSPAREGFPSWSPDGEKIAYLSGTSQLSDIYVMRPDGSDPSRLTDSAGMKLSLSWSPDSKQMVYSATGPPLTDSPSMAYLHKELWIVRADGTDNRRLTAMLTDDEFASDPSWSPDGSMIVFSSKRIEGVSGTPTSWGGTVLSSGIYVIKADGTDQKRLTDDQMHTRSPSWTPDGRILFAASKARGNDNGLYLMNPDGTGIGKAFGSSNTIYQPKLVAGYFEPVVAVDAAATRPEAQPSKMVQQPAQASVLPKRDSPDSERDGSAHQGQVAFVSGRDGNPEIYVINADGSGLKRLTQNDYCDGLRSQRSVMDASGMGTTRPHLPRHFGTLLWSPDGEKLVFKSRTSSFTCMDRDGSHHRRVGGDDYASFSPDGKRMAVVDGSTIYIENEDGSAQQVLTPGWCPVFLPDGNSMVCGSELSGLDGIYLVTADGRSITRLTPTDSKYWGHAVSPDGERIAFNSGRDGNVEIYLMHVDGSGMERLTRHPGKDCYPKWSPDGERIAFSSDRRGDYDVYTVRTDGRGLTNVTRSPANDWSPSWSPDSRKLAFESDRDGNFEIYVVNADGSEPRRLTSHPAWDGNPIWSPSPAKRSRTDSANLPGADLKRDALEAKGFVGAWTAWGERVVIILEEDGSCSMSGYGELTNGRWTRNDEGAATMHVEGVDGEFFRVELLNGKLKMTQVRKLSSGKTRDATSILFDRK